MTTLRAAAVTVDVRLGDVDGNLARMHAAVTAGVAAGARLIVLPELATSGYVFADAEEARAAALASDDPRLDALGAELPAGAVLVFGYAELDGDAVYNTAAVLGRDGRIADYRKSHLWAREKLVFAPGDAAGAVVDTSAGRLGVAICYDNEFPEVPRRLALAGAEVLALPVNWPLVPRPDGERPPEVVQAMASARSSRLPTVIADRSGSERGVVWTGGTAILDGDGWIAALPDEGMAVADLALSADKSLGELNDLFGDRRPELY